MIEGIRGSMIGRRAEAFQKTPEKGEPTRREALATVAINMANGALATTLVAGIATRMESSGTPNVVAFPARGIFEGQQAEETGSEAHEAESGAHQVPPELVGRTPAGLERRYLGPEAGSRRLPEQLPPIAFGENLRAMLDEKKDIVADARTGSDQQRVYERLADSYDALAQHGQLRKTDLKGFRSLIEQETYKTLDALDGKLADVARVYFRGALADRGIEGADAERLEAGLAAALRYLARHVTPDVQLAYIATEIMPSPERGAALLSFLLENAGIEFIERIPALGDQELSYGPFQLTPYAVGEEGSATRLLANARQSDLVPRDLAQFSSMEDHLRAGFAFGMHNLTALMQDLVKRGKFEEIAALCESASAGSENGRSTVFLEYLAAAHHRPVVAREVMHSWFEKNTRLPKAARARSLAAYFDDSPADEQVKAYAGKAEQHFKHIQRFFAARKGDER